MKKIVIITDGGLKIGLGHIYRSISLARELSQHARVEYLIKGEKLVMSKLKKAHYPVYGLKRAGDVKKQLALMKPDIVIIDRLNVQEQFAKFIKTDLNARLVIFGNLSSANRYADIVINAIIGTDFKNKSFVAQDSDTFYLQGPRYLVLGGEFYKHRDSYASRNNLERILLIFGGSDQANLSSRILDLLLKTNCRFKIKLVLGALFKFNGSLEKVLKKYKDKKDKVSIYRDVDNVHELMSEVDLVVTSPGTTMFESLCIGIPTVAFYQSRAQKNIFNGFVLAHDLDKMKRLDNFIFNIHRDHCAIKKKIAAFDIGNGKDEIVRSILNLTKK